MAIKERKQITGTTAQIDAYAGHEGQIVWDKEKKTFVGMSGTAGNNYPLAPKEYVDNEVAKCLPLTGGKLTGDLYLKDGGKLYQSKNESYGYVVLTSERDGSRLNGCSLFLANPDSLDKGSMILRYVDGSGGNHELAMNGENGELLWNRRPIESIFAHNAETYVRYSSGLQIIYLRTFADPGGFTLSFSNPFSSNPIAVATHKGTDRFVNVTVDCTSTSAVFRTSYDSRVQISALIIGRWK